MEQWSTSFGIHSSLWSVCFENGNMSGCISGLHCDLTDKMATRGGLLA